METTKSNSGRGLGIASLIIGIVTVFWSIKPILGAGALWPSLLGLTLAMVGLALSLHGQNPKRGIIIAGIILCMFSTGVSAYWNSAINQSVQALNTINVQ